VNVDAVRSLVTTLGKKTGIRLVHCSSVAAVGVSDKPDMILDEKVAFNAASIHYNDTKWRGEKIVLEAAQRGMDAVVVNPGMIIGAHGLKEVQRSVVRKIAQGAMRMYPPGGNCFSFVEDVADGMILAFDLGRKGERYILGGHNLTYGDYFGRIAGLFGVKPPGIRLSPLALPFLGGLADLLFGKLGWDAGKLAALFGFYSSAKAERELGYRISPMDTIIESLRPLGDPHAECA
jgi:dihydroflavonol-4-reductase